MIFRQCDSYRFSELRLGYRIEMEGNSQAEERIDYRLAVYMIRHVWEESRHSCCSRLMKRHVHFRQHLLPFIGWSSSLFSSDVPLLPRRMLSEEAITMITELSYLLQADCIVTFIGIRRLNAPRDLYYIFPRWYDDGIDTVRRLPLKKLSSLKSEASKRL